MERIPGEMRKRLHSNRQGKLSRSQYQDMVTEPFTVLLLLLTPGIIILGPRLIRLGWRGIFFVLVVIALVVFVPVIFRALRYARAPVYFARLYAPDRPAGRLLPWQALRLYTEKGAPVRFRRRLASRLPLRPNHAYLVYYLREPKDNVLLSLAPADHPDAEQWQPGESVHQQF